MIRKIYIAGLLTIILVIVGCVFVAANFFWGMDKSFEVAQKQAARGRAYMNSMQDADYQETLALAKELMLEPPAEHGWKTLSRWDSRDVPQQWKARGIVFIRYRPDWVSFGWQGGPFAHTSLEFRKIDPEGFKATAHYTDNEPEKELRVLK